MRAEIVTIPRDGDKSPAQILSVAAERRSRGRIFAVDFYIEGAEGWLEHPGGWRHPDEPLVNVDHHAPHARMRRHISSANLALDVLAAGEAPESGDLIVVSHMDCDTVLAAGILAGRLEPRAEYGHAAIAADHTGAEHPVADLLQALDAHWSRNGKPMPDRDGLHYFFDCLARLERDAPLDAFAQEALEHRVQGRARARRIAAEGPEPDRGVFFRTLDEPVEGELLLPHAHDAWIVATMNPHRRHTAKWQAKVRLGGGAPAWLSLQDMGIEAFDPAYGGRWNAGSNNRKGGSPLTPDEYRARLAAALDNRRLERAIEIAVEAHRGQTDKAGAPYILHPLRVMMSCGSVEAKILGVLHDVVEDTDWTFERLEAEGFSEAVIEGLRAVTKSNEKKEADPDAHGEGGRTRSGEQTEAERLEGYLAFCRRAATDPLAAEVKRADILDNMDVSRLREVGAVERARLGRYAAGLKEIERVAALGDDGASASATAVSEGATAAVRPRTATATFEHAVIQAPKAPPTAPGTLPALLAHADWGSDASKRWMCVAALDGTDSYAASPPEPVGDPTTLIERLQERAGGGRVLVGFDFPIGIPAAYAERAGVSSFPALLPRLGSGDWARFYDVAESRDEISLTRPFYPMRPGGTRQAHLIEALGVDTMADLLRRCDRKQPYRGAASPIFWTLGGKQVGKAALLGWRKVLVPALSSADARIGLWPFGGSLSELVPQHDVTIAETYPAEACLHLGLTPPGTGWTKTSQDGRRRQRDSLFGWMDSRPVTLAPKMVSLIDDGFGASKDAEDPFDAMLGLLSMIDVVTGRRDEGAPDTAEVRAVEGWILGQSADPRIVSGGADRPSSG